MARQAHRLARLLAPAVVALLTIVACSRGVAPIGAGGRPFTLEADERPLWAGAEKEEQALLKRVAVFDDQVLADYLGRVGERLLADEARAAGAPVLRFVVLRDPTLNAFAMPNGWIFVHTGLLASLENEAQLAVVLAREIAHVRHRHALAAARAAVGVPGLSTAAGVAASIGAAAVGARRGSDEAAGDIVLGRTASAILGLGLTVATRAAIDGYGGDLEGEADRAALDALARAGYGTGQAAKIFEVLLADAGARGPAETFLLGRSASLRERLDSFRRLLQARREGAGTGSTGTVKGAVGERGASANGRDGGADAGSAREGAEGFARYVRLAMRENAVEEARLGRFALAERQLDRVLAATPDDAMAQVDYGELRRLQTQRARTPEEATRLAGLAAARLARAAALDPTLAEPYRQLGLLHYQRQDAARSREAFTRYLELRPDAPDAPRIREYLIELSR